MQLSVGIQLSTVVDANNHIAGKQKDNISVNTCQMTIPCAALCQGVCIVYFKNEKNNNNLGYFYKVRKANKAAVGQLYEDLANSICRRQKQTHR